MVTLLTSEDKFSCSAAGLHPARRVSNPPRRSKGLLLLRHPLDRLPAEVGCQMHLVPRHFALIRDLHVGSLYVGCNGEAEVVAIHLPIRDGRFSRERAVRLAGQL